MHTPPSSSIRISLLLQVGVAVRGFEAHVAEDENVPPQHAPPPPHLGVAPAVGGVGCVASLGGSVGSGLVASGGRNGAVGIWDPRAPEPRVAVLPGHMRKNVKQKRRSFCLLASALGVHLGMTLGVTLGVILGALRVHLGCTSFGIATTGPLFFCSNCRCLHTRAPARVQVSCACGVAGGTGAQFVTGGWDGRLRVWDLRMAADDRMVRRARAPCASTLAA